MAFQKIEAPGTDKETAGTKTASHETIARELRFNNWGLAHHVKLDWILLNRSGRNDGIATMMLEYRAHVPEISPLISSDIGSELSDHSPHLSLLPLFVVDCLSIRSATAKACRHPYACIRRPAQFLACIQCLFPYSHGQESRCSSHTRST